MNGKVVKNDKPEETTRSVNETNASDNSLAIEAEARAREKTRRQIAVWEAAEALSVELKNVHP